MSQVVKATSELIAAADFRMVDKSVSSTESYVYAKKLIRMCCLLGIVCITAADDITDGVPKGAKLLQLLKEVQSVVSKQHDAVIQDASSQQLLQAHIKEAAQQGAAAGMLLQREPVPLTELRETLKLMIGAAYKASKYVDADGKERILKASQTLMQAGNAHEKHQDNTVLYLCIQILIPFIASQTVENESWCRDYFLASNSNSDSKSWTPAIGCY